MKVPSPLSLQQQPQWASLCLTNNTIIRRISYGNNSCIIIVTCASIELEFVFRTEGDGGGHCLRSSRRNTNNLLWHELRIILFWPAAIRGPHRPTLMGEWIIKWTNINFELYRERILIQSDYEPDFNRSSKMNCFQRQNYDTLGCVTAIHQYEIYCPRFPSESKIPPIWREINVQWTKSIHDNLEDKINTINANDRVIVRCTFSHKRDKEEIPEEKRDGLTLI